MGVKIGTKGDKHNAWKGDQVGYSARHKWVVAIYGSPSFCEDCKRTTPPEGLGIKRSYFQWSNVSGKYLRDIKDWRRLCYLCHNIFDKIYHARKPGPKPKKNGK